MFVRVFDKKNNIYYKSIVYALLGKGWHEQYIVLNPNTRNFELVDYLDKQTNPTKPLVEKIQSNEENFVVYKDDNLLKYKLFCKDNGYEYVEIKFEMKGYPEVIDNNAFLAKILINRSVPFNEYSIPIRNLEDTSEWNYILTQEDADDFMHKFAHFHDSTLDKLSYSDSYSATTVNAIFDNSGWFGVVELCFESVQILKIVPSPENYTKELYEASLIVKDECVFWADSFMDVPNETYEGSLIKALSLKWRKIK